MKLIELLDNIQKEWTIKEKARYLYRMLGKEITYDERFNYSQDKELLENIYHREIEIEKEEVPQIVCNSINKAYAKLLTKAGIKCKLIYKKPKDEKRSDLLDVALIFWDENEDKYFTNISADIQNCKYGLQTSYFGIRKNLYEEAQDVKEISKDELRKMDLKTNCIQYDYYDRLYTLLTEEVKNTNHFKKFLQSQGIHTKQLTRDDILELKMQYIITLIKFTDKLLEPDEIKKLYSRLFRAAALDKFEKKKIEIFEFVKEDENEIDIISCIEIKLAKEVIYYVYKKEERSYLKIPKEELEEKLKGYREKSGKKPMIQKKVEEAEDEFFR